MLILALPRNLRAQEEAAHSVEWIGQFPAVEGEAARKWGDRLTTLLFGEKQMALVKPFGVVAIHPDDYWILDQGAGTILQVQHGKAKMNRPMVRGGVEYPSLVGVCSGKGSDLYFTDSRLNQFYRLSGDGINAMTTAENLMQPTGIAFHPTRGEIWVSETAGHRIAIFDPEGRLLRRIGKRGKHPGDFNFPTYLWIDKEGRVYIVDSMNFRVQVLDADGNFLFCFGENGDGTGQMARPKGIATDSYGNIYLADALFHVVQIFDREGHYLENFGGQGQGTGELWMPAGIFIDAQDRIYVADTYNARIQIFQLVTP
jgi:DNA-binding beta-propeller fold protein YncE